MIFYKNYISINNRQDLVTIYVRMLTYSYTRIRVMWHNFLFTDVFSRTEYNTLLACTTSAILSSIVASMSFKTLCVIFVRIIVVIILTLIICYVLVLSDNTKTDIKQRLQTTIKHLTNITTTEAQPKKKNIFS